MNYEAIVIGVSSGGMNAMKVMFSLLPKNFSIPIIIVQHISAHSDSQWIELLNEKSNLNIKEADEKEKIEKGNVYIAPSNYHLLIGKDKTFSLTIVKPPHSCIRFSPFVPSLLEPVRTTPINLLAYESAADSNNTSIEGLA